MRSRPLIEIQAVYILRLKRRNLSYTFQAVASLPTKACLLYMYTYKLSCTESEVLGFRGTKILS
jgi:hypothetical protein